VILYKYNMNWPNLQEEKKLWRRGYERVAGVDEAGRGPLAGPVVASAVLLKSDFNGVKDSKKLTPEQREKLYKILTKHSAVEWGIGRVSERVIDKINILEATKLAMIKAIQNLEKKSKKEPSSLKRSSAPFWKIDFLILDGNFRINLPVPQKSIIKGDEKVFSCAAASIIAKVTRDRIMQRYDKKYPIYGFNHHKGYPTRLHRKNLKKHGPCKIHRKTFGSVWACVEKRNLL